MWLIWQGQSIGKIVCQCSLLQHLSRVSDMKDRMGMTTVFNCAGVDKEKFLDYTEKNPATYKVSI